MTPAFTARRRAEEFDSLVEGTSTGRSDARYAEFLSIVEGLRNVPAPEARPEFVSDLRERLMLAAATELVPSAEEEARLTLPQRRPKRERRLAVAVGGLAIVGATTSMAVAAQSALPGDALYPLKRAIENAQTGFSTDEGDQGSHLLASASGRLDEVAALSSEDNLEGNAQIPATLNAFTDQATQASDLLLSDYASTGHEQSIEELRSFAADSMQQLSVLEDVVPADARDELFHAARVLQQIDEEAAQACPGCDGGITQVPTILTSGLTDLSGTPTGESVGSGGTTGQGGTKGADPLLPNTGGTTSLPPGSVLNAPSQADTSNPSGTGTGSGGQATDPLEQLTDGLIGGDSESTSNGDQGDGGGLPQLPDLGDTVDDLTDPLLGGN
jgi:hypothetical protein